MPDVHPDWPARQPGPTLEQDGMLFVWNDPERKPPPSEVTIPRIEGASSDEWTDWHWYTNGCGNQQLPSKIIDKTSWIWRTSSISTAQLPTYFKNIFEGHRR